MGNRCEVRPYIASEPDLGVGRSRAVSVWRVRGRSARAPAAIASAESPFPRRSLGISAHPAATPPRKFVGSNGVPVGHCCWSFFGDHPLPGSFCVQPLWVMGVSGLAVGRHGAGPEGGVTAPGGLNSAPRGWPCPRATECLMCEAALSRRRCDDIANPLSGASVNQ